MYRVLNPANVTANVIDHMPYVTGKFGGSFNLAI